MRLPVAPHSVRLKLQLVVTAIIVVGVRVRVCVVEGGGVSGRRRARGGSGAGTQSPLHPTHWAGQCWRRQGTRGSSARQDPPGRAWLAQQAEGVGE